MTTNKALELLLEAWEAGEITLMEVPLDNGLNIGLETMVALAALSRCLHLCESLEDLMAAVRFGVRMYLAGVIDHRVLIRMIAMIADDAGKQTTESASN